MQPLADTSGGKRIREQEDEVTKLRQPVVPLRADVAGPPPAYRPIGHLYDRGDVDLGDAEGFQGIDDLAGLDRPVQGDRHRGSSATSGSTTVNATAYRP
ncbi:Uncharacterised protein [Mycobacterium tuberculosis]|uniref:Uncharacterized protein n=1 Tax=Mycobacterium tuberculosis TaxID=1773 RepID=A0A655AT33_MYCTX|nr:Uncharacterised protein [Mycobacterium tuberculosis]CKT86821.1 Uncharacterised protein [Mycobacterium tuberculosis]COW60953.1 Uncharacterised protein [Mycobacterium tuberculosis]